ncbi:MAG: hypothetical protein KGN40_02790 [Burkholderiales bacterium]|nr:hypothetical protein [Burkholderiales bacterium]
MTSRLVAFLEGSGTDSQGRGLSDIWQFDDDTIDFTHDFIQWMFPLREASGSNFTAPTLLASEIETIRSSLQCLRNLEESTKWMLSFFNRTEVFFYYTNHNHLRVTRIIKSLRLLHSDLLADKFKQEVLDMVQSRAARINPVTVAFWLSV